MDTEEPKVTYNECVNVCACVHVCVRREKKGMTVDMKVFRDKFPRQWRSSEQSKDINAAVMNNPMQHMQV